MGWQKCRQSNRDSVAVGPELKLNQRRESPADTGWGGALAHYMTDVRPHSVYILQPKQREIPTALSKATNPNSHALCVRCESGMMFEQRLG